MKRTGLRRAVSGVLSVAITATTIFADFTVPTSIYASDEAALEISSESSLTEYSESNASITSDYISTNLDEDMGSEAAALNEEAALTVAEEYLLSEASETTDASETTGTDVSTSSNDADTVSTSGNDVDAVSASGNDVGIMLMSMDETADEASEEVTVSEEDIAALAEEILDSADDILTADDYDDNGIAASYHYITLSYALVDAGSVWDGMTISDVWEYIPDKFIASYVTNVNVYTMDGNEDYYVAFADPGILNGIGSGIYADFTDDDTFNPTIYNDIISFDAETGLIYIPKSFYYNEDGEEVLKNLVAEILVPYDFDDDTTSLSVSVNSEIDGVEGISGTSEVAALDVTVTFPIVSSEDADKISIEDLYVTVNDDPYPFDLTNDGGYYDTETGELTIAVSGNTVYSVDVTIKEDAEEETLALLSEKEILVASVGDLSGIIAADTTFYGNTNYATNVALMQKLPDVTISGSSIKRGQEYTYTGNYQYVNNYSSSNTDSASKVITNTAPYCYYYISGGSATAVTNSNYGGVNADGTVSSTVLQIGSTVLCNTASPDSNFNRIAQLPSSKLTSTDGVGTATWSANISGNPSGYTSYVALHCAGNATEITSSAISGSDTLVIYILYVSSNYIVFALNSPYNSSQSGSSVYKIAVKEEYYYAKIGIEKVDEDNSSQYVAGAVYGLFTSLSDAETVADKSYSSASAATTGITSNSGLAKTTVSTGVTYWDTQSWSATGSKYKTYYVTEVYAPSGYIRDTNVYAITVTGTTTSTGVGCSISSPGLAYSPDGMESRMTRTNSTTVGSYMIHKEYESYYGAMNLIKKDDDGNYISGAVYALIETGANVSYSTYTELAKEAYEASSSGTAALKKFYSLMAAENNSAGTATLASYIVGAYTTGSSGSVQLKSVSSSGTVGSSTTLDFGTSPQKKYVLVEVWTPTGYTLDDSYYAFYLQANGNTTDSYTTAVNKTTMITSTSSSTTAPLHQTSGSTANSTNTWSDYATITNNTSSSSTTAALTMSVTDDDATYYGTMNLTKKDLSNSSKYVGGAVYVLIDSTSLTESNYTTITSYASTAYNANNTSSTAAMKAFYSSMSSKGYAGYIVGAYTTTGTSTAAQLKAVTTSGTINSSTNAVINFGQSDSKRFVLVEVWTPEGYTLDTSYYAFTLTTTNEDSTYSTAVQKTKMVTSSTSTDAPVHRASASGTNTWSTYASVSNGGNVTAAIRLNISEVSATYYAAMNFEKLDADDTSTHVTGAAYMLIDYDSSITSTVLKNIRSYASSANDDSSSASAAIVNFYESMSSAGYAGKIEGVYVSGSSTVTLQKFNTSTGARTGSKVLDLGDSNEASYLLVEIYSPSTYTLDTGYSTFTLCANKNETSTYATALDNTTISWLTKGSRVEKVSGNTIGGDLTLTMGDTKSSYYAAANLKKVDPDGDPVAGAVYALIDAETGVSATNCQTYAATSASKSSATAAVYSFYNSLGSYKDSLVGVYRTNSNGDASPLKSFDTSTGAINSSDSITLDFGNDTDHNYYLIEIYSPKGYELDGRYYSFTLNSKNETNSVTSALNGTTISNYKASSGSFTSRITISGNNTTSQLCLEVTEEFEYYYGALNIAKKDAETGSYVGGAVYVLIDEAGYTSTNYASFLSYAKTADAAGEAAGGSKYAATLSFYNSMKSAGFADNIEGIYYTSSSGSAGLKSFDTSTGAQTTFKTLDFGQSDSKTYVLIEIYSPEGYNLDESYSVFTLNNNWNTTNSYTTACQSTTLSSWTKQADGYASTSGGSSTSANIIITLKDTQYYAALNLTKLLEGTTGTYVGGAFYVIMEKDSDTSYAKYREMAASAYESATDNTEARLNFYELADAAGVSSDIVGFYQTYSDGSDATLMSYSLTKALAGSLNRTDTDFVFNLGEDTERQYVIMEVWSPSGYTRDTDLQAVTLKANGNTSSDRDTALLKTTLTWNHQGDNASTSGATSTTVALKLKLTDEEAGYHAAMDLKKVDTDGEPVRGAVYALIDAETGVTAANCRTYAATAASTSSATAAVYSFYNSLGSYKDSLVGVYRTNSAGTATPLKSFNTSTGAINDSDYVTLSLGNISTHKYILVEIYSPLGYSLDGRSYTFTLNSNGNEDSDRDTALKNTTIQDYSASSGTFDSLITITGNNKTSSLCIETTDEEETYYGAVDIAKKDSVTGEYVGGAVYALIDEASFTSANYSSILSYAKTADAAGEAAGGSKTKATLSFYNSMKSAGFAGYIEGVYYTSASGSAGLKSFNTSTGAQTTFKTLDFGQNDTKSYVLVEIYSPEGYNLDESYSVFTLNSNRNTTNNYTTACKATTLESFTTKASGYSYTNGGSSTTVKITHVMKDTPENTYAALDLIKVEEGSTTTYVGGAFYVIMEKASGVTYAEYRALAKEAYESASDNIEARLNFYELADAAGVSSDIVGFYQTYSDGSVARLSSYSLTKALAGSLNVTDTNFTFDFGTDSTKSYVIMEVWSPAGYERDWDLEAFTLSSNGNTSDDRDDALLATTLTWDHQGSNAGTTGATSTTVGLKLTLADTPVTYNYYAALDVTKLQEGTTDTYVGGAVYAILEKEDYTYAQYRTLAQNIYAASTSNAEATLNLYKMANDEGILSSVVGIYRTASDGSNASLISYSPTNALAGSLTVTDRDFVFDLGSSPSKQYIIIEIWSPYGYTLDDDCCCFKLLSNGNTSDDRDTALLNTTLTWSHQSDSVTSSGATSTSAKLLLKFTDEQGTYAGRFMIQKTDEDGNEVAVKNVGFTVYSDAACTTAVKTIYTNSSGLATFSFTQSGTSAATYYVKETSLPTALAGMDMNTDVYKVVVTPAASAANSTIKVYSGSTGATATTAVSTSSSTLGYTFNMVNEHKTFMGMFTIQKTDDAGNAKTVSGVTFYVYNDKNCTDLAYTITTNGAGIATCTLTDWEADDSGSNGKKTFYVTEDADTVPSGMAASEEVYKVVVTGSTEKRSASTITVTDSSGESVPTNGYAYGFNFANHQYTQYTVVKETGSVTTANLLYSVTVELYADGESTGKSHYLTESNSWSYTWTGLDKYDPDDLHEIEYTAVEKTVRIRDYYDRSTIYTVSYANLDTVFRIAYDYTTGDRQTTITNTLYVTSLDVVKTFTDTSVENRISEITVTLYRNGESTGKTLTLDSSNSWSGTFGNLIKYDRTGTAYEYTAVETKVKYVNQEGTTCTVTNRTNIEKLFSVDETTADGTTTIINDFETVDLDVVKLFDDTGAKTSDLVKSVTVRLYADGVSMADITGYEDITLSNGNSWKDSWTGLDKYDNKGNEITYTVKEVGAEVIDSADSSVTVTVLESNIDNVFTVTYSVSGGTATVTNKINTTTLDVEKTFGANVGDRITGVVLTLTINGKDTGRTITLNKNNNWSGTFENLVQYDGEGNLYEYSAKETSVTYTDMWGTEHTITDESIIKKVFTVSTSASDGKVTIKNTFRTTSHSLTKARASAKTQELLTGVTAMLYADGVSLESQFGNAVLSGSTWTYSWSGLDAYDYQGNEITYTVKEISAEVADDYDGTVSTVEQGDLTTVFNVSYSQVGYNSSTTLIVNVIRTTYLKVEKTFGADTEDRISSVEVTLYRNGVSTGETVTLDKDGSWTDTFTNLIMYDPDGNEYEYTAVETAVTYTDMWGDEHTVTDRNVMKKIFTVTEETDGTKTTIDNALNFTEYTVSKTLDSDLTEDLVTGVSTELYADGDTYDTVTLSSDNSWTNTWTGLDEYDYQGNKITYSAAEVSVSMKDQLRSTVSTVSASNIETVFDVTISTSAGETQIGNTLVTTELDVEKVFGDDDTKDRVKQVMVMLYRNGTSTGKILTLSASNSWSGTFTDLVKYDASGNEYTYTAAEFLVVYTDMWGTVRGLTSSSVINKLFTVETSTEDGKTTIKNTFNFAEYTVSKTLDSSLTESLVTDVTVELYADGETFDTVVLDDSNSWENSTWKNTLDKYDYKGNEIDYSAAEVGVSMKDQFHTATVNSVTTAIGTVFTVDVNETDEETQIGNTVVTTKLDVEKVFGNDDTKDRIKQVTVMLYRNGTATGKMLVLSASNSWSGTFTDLVKYDPDGNEYTYTAGETIVVYTDMWGTIHGITSSAVLNKLFTVETVTEDGKTTIKNTFNTVDYAVEKSLGSTLTKSLVKSVTMELYADGKTFDSVVLSDANSWNNSEWKGTLDEYDYLGNLISYTSGEVEIEMEDQFDASVIYKVTSAIETVFDVIISASDYETKIENTVETTDLYVEKVFGVNTKDRISEVVVTLYRNGVAMPYTITLNDGNDWKGTFETLVKYDPDGNEYEYRAVETSVTYTDMWGDTYTVTDRTAIENLFDVEEVTSDNRTTVTNTFQFTERNVMKLFATKITSDRLVQITARIYADGRDASSLFGDRILNADTNWIEIWDGYNSKNVWVGLDKFDHNGKLIDYTTKEIQAIYTDKDSPVETQHIVSGGTLITIFEPVYDDDADETTSSITNELQTVDLKVVKTWGDNTESHLVSIVAELWENNNPTGKTVTLSKDNGWTYTWEDLDKYDSTAKAYKYEAKEISVTYTDMWGDTYTVTPDDLMNVIFEVETTTEDYVTTIKNTYATTEYTVSKTFGSSLTESLITAITARLYADGSSLESVFGNRTLRSDNSWTDTWTALDKYDAAGNEITYTAEEVSVLMKDQFHTTTVNTVRESAVNTVFDVKLTPDDGSETIENTVVTTSLDVEKVFGNDDTENRIRQVSAMLYRNGTATGRMITLNASNGWSGTFTDLVKYDPSGNEYTYTAVEFIVVYTDMWGSTHGITNQTVINRLFTVETGTENGKTTIKNTFNTVDYTVEKSLGSTLTESLVKSVTMELYADGKTFDSVVLSDANSWSNSEWKGTLDEYDYLGNLISYTSEEVEVRMEDQFDGSVVNTVTSAIGTVFDVIISASDYETEIKNTVETTELDVEKVFGNDDTENRISEVEVTLTRNGEKMPYTLTLNASNSWTDTFTDLVKYDPDGNEYEYAAVETGVTYTDMWGDTYTVTDADVLNKLFEIKEETADNKTTVTNTFNTVGYKVEKDLGSTLTESLAKNVTMALIADGRTFDTVVLSDANSWSNSEWKGTLDEYDHNGNLISYTSEEVEVQMADQFDGSTVNTVSTAIGTVFDVIISASDYKTQTENTVVTTNLEVEKAFGDNTEDRISEVEVTLTRNGIKMPYTLTLNASNSWTDTFTDLVKYDPDGNEYEYRAAETSVTYTDMWGDTYTVTDTDVMDKLFNVTAETADGKTIITNTFEYTERIVVKSFATDLTLRRMVNITTTLYADGASLESVFADVTLSRDNAWASQWTGLDKYDAYGNKIVYTVKETTATYLDMDGDEYTVMDDALVTIFAPEVDDELNETASEITNEFAQTSHTVVKTFGDNTEGRVTGVTAELYRNGLATGRTAVLNETNSWTYTWTELDEYDSTGTEYTYTAVETEVTYTDIYGASQTIDGQMASLIFNAEAETGGTKTVLTNTIEVKDHSVNKVFNAEAADGVEYITVQLYADGNKLGSEVTITKADGWTYTWENLDKYNPDGSEIVYTVKEVMINDGITPTAADGYIVTYDDTAEATTVITNDTTKVAIEKVDIETGKPVEGAVLSLYVLNDDNTKGERIDTWVVEDEPYYIEKLPEGNYIVVENLAPGYYVTAEEMVITVKATAEVKTFTMKDDFTKVQITKTDIVTGEEVTGAVLSIYKKNTDGTRGDLVDSWTTTDEPYYIDRLAKGSYILVEEYAPAQYVTANDMVFTVDDTGEIQKVEMVDGVTQVLISKTDITTDAEVAGAKLTVYSVDDSGNREFVESWTSTTRPHYIEGLVKGDYVLVEEYAPTCYVTAQEVKFTVIDTGEVQTVEMVDDFTKVEILKVDIETGEPVVGAVLELYAKNDDGSRGRLVDKWTTDGTAHYIERLDKGGYILVETYAPGEYVSGEMTFTVVDTDEVQTFTMEDDFTKVEISKTDIVTGEEVEGAKLTIYTVDDNGNRTEYDSWTSTAEPHYIERMPKGNYVLVEEYAPGSYVTANEVEFTVKDTGEIQKVTMVDDFTKVQISKTDLVDGKEVVDATLTVYRVNDDGTRTWIDTWVTDGTPHTIERLDKGIYVLVEENTPNGYQVAEEVTFEVTDTGEVQKVEMKDDRTYGKVEVKKVDENGDPIEGVEFTITNKETGEVIEVLKTDADGYAESKEMPIDERQADQTLKAITYTIQETKTVGNYTLDNTVTEFEYTYVDDTTPVVTYSLGVTNELQKGRIAVMKKGIAAVDTTTVETVYGNVEKLVYDYIYLPGVEFTIYADEDLTEVVATITTDKDGAAYSDYLPVGTYYVVETFTPAGYVADDTVYTVNITGDDTGKLYVVDVTKDIVNHPCSVTINIYKEGSYLVSTQTGYEEKTKPLEGVVIGIYAAEDIANYIGTTVIEKDTLIAVLVTDEDGLATMTETLPAGSYYYKELKALDGYVLDETKHEFSVSYDNDNATLEVNKDNPLVNYIQSGTLNVHKVDQNGNALGAGVEFLVTCTNTGETWTLVTDADGNASLTELAIGAYVNGTWEYYTYTLQETKTLDGYKLDDTVYTWQFTADNTNAEAVYQSFTVRNVILGIVSYNTAGGVSMLMLAFVLVLMAIRKKKEPGSQVLRPTTRDEEEELEIVTETSEE